MKTNTQTNPRTYGLIFDENCAAFGIGAAISLLEQNLSLNTVVACGTGVINAMLLASRDIPAMRAAWETPEPFNAIFAKTAQLANRFVSDWGNMSSTIREAATEAALNEPDALRIKSDLHRIFDEKTIRASDLNIVIISSKKKNGLRKLQAQIVW